jgi:uncharacterized membrane protein
MRNSFSPSRLLLLILLISLLLVVVQMELVSLVFAKLGLSAGQGMLLLLFSLMGSLLNLPLLSIKAEMPKVEIKINTPQGLLHIPIPFEGKTVIAVNVGGCLIPLVFSASLIHRFPIPTSALLLTTCLCSIICFLASRPIPGIGIGMMPLVAPLTAAIIAITFGGEYAAPLAYITGTLGVIIGADLMHMKDISRLGTPVASIGGAGTFDGIFLTGIVAVLLT